MKLSILLMITVSAFGQRSQNGLVTMPKGTSLPTSCTIGDSFFKSDATAGQNLYGCTATDTWTAQGGAGGATISQGTFAALPGTCATGDLYFFTNSLYTSGRCSAANTWSYFFDGKVLTPPSVYGTWTADPGNTGNSYAETNGPGVITPDGTAAHAYGRYIAAPTAPYVRTVAVRYSLLPSDYTAIQFGLRQGSGANTGRKQTVGVNWTGSSSNYAGWLRVQSSSSAFGYVSSTDLIPNTGFSGVAIFGSNLIYLQVEDDNTNLYWRVSVDGFTFYTVLSVAHAAAYVDVAATPQLVYWSQSGGGTYGSAAFVGLY